jgi:hypothetical protein
MRLTVGPLPPAVYWRRRAIVLGVAVLLVFAIVQSCSGGEAKPDDRATAPTSQAAGPDPTVSVLRPQTRAPAPAPVTQPAPTAAATSAAAAPASGDCTDAEMSVIPVPALTTAPRGATIDIRLKLKNISKRTCTRDVGADVQEIYIKRGAVTVWSSDKCGQVKGSEPREFTPNFEREYSVGWNGRDVTRCANNLANGPVPPAGEYQVFGRLGTKTSNPVKLTLT